MFKDFLCDFSFLWRTILKEFQSHVQLNKKLPYDPRGWMLNHFSMCGKMALVHKYLCVCVFVLNVHALMSNTGTVWRKPMEGMYVCV